MAEKIKIKDQLKSNPKDQAQQLQPPVSPERAKLLEQNRQKLIESSGSGMLRKSESAIEKRRRLLESL